jgi:predicted CoA-binding protein
MLGEEGYVRDRCEIKARALWPGQARARDRRRWRDGELFLPGCPGSMIHAVPVYSPGEFSHHRRRRMAVTDKDELRQIYASARTIAVVGASGDATKPAHTIPRYLQSQGYRIIPVSPKGGELFGEKVYQRLADVPGPVDVVDVFRPAAETPDIAREAVALGARVLWLQAGIVSAEAEQIAAEGGLTVVMDRCMGATHGELGLGPGPGR